MSDRMAIALAQLNPVVGDIPGNLKRARAAHERARAEGADLVLFSELFITGYPPEDLVLKPAFQTDAMDAVKALAKDTADGPAVLIGTPWVQDGALYNAVALLDAGAVQAVSFKVDLPNYGVFDEKRVFRPGPMPGPFNVRGVRIGVPICEDIWGSDPVECLSETGSEMLLVPNGSPFDAGKRDHRLNVAVARVVEAGLPLVYLNQVGGQDELVFDGASFVLNADRRLALQLPSWEEAVVLTQWTRDDGQWVCAPGTIADAEEMNAALYAGMVLGLKDYVNKNRFPGVVLGLSGGIDSALSAAVAVDALGAERVRCVMMPSRYTVGGQPRRCERGGEAPGRAARLDPDRATGRCVRRSACRCVQREEARHDRGEPPVAHPRRHPDGAVEQVRPDGADDRQQVRDVGRLRHALWRHVRRLQCAQGSLQDAGLRDLALAQPVTRPKGRWGRRAE